MRFLMTGATGFVGTELREHLLKNGHYITVITRSPGKYEDESARNQRFVDWDDELSPAMEEADVVVHLAGENLFGKRWTEEVKKRIYSSRVDTARRLVEAMGKADPPPDLLISVSGVNYYGDRGDTPLNESAPPGDGFLSTVCEDWEAAAQEAERHGVRVVNPRLGVVLGSGGGALQLMTLPFKLFVGGPIGPGDQYFPWIHMHDLCRGLLYPVENEDMEGPYNLASPGAVTMDEFAEALGDVLNRPSFFRVPAFAVRKVLGEAADPILESLNIRPDKLRDAGFEFEFKDVRVALSDIL